MDKMNDFVSKKSVIALAKDIVVPIKDGDYRHRCIDPQQIMELPAADVRPVVLCRDCGHFAPYSVINADGTGKCGLCGKRPIGFIVDEYDFCSSGERRGAKMGGVIDDP